MRMTSLLTATLLTGTVALTSAPLAAYDVAGMRDAMHSVFNSMQTLLDLSTDPVQLAAPANRTTILHAAFELEEQANIISAHVPRDEISFLASSLNRYAMWIRKSYEWRLYDDTQQLVHATVNVCIACHTRVTSRRDSPFAEDFINSARIGALPLRQRVKLQTATRRFDDVLGGYAMLVEQAVGDEDFVQLARDYLVLALRVKVDQRRARDLLEALLKRPKLAGERRDRVVAWVHSLEQLSKLPVSEADLASAQRLVEQAENVADIPSTDSLVYYIVASRLLYDYLENSQDRASNNQGTAGDGAKAYYLLGLAQHRIDPEAWLPQSELYLEKSIRTAPASQHARKAFELLSKKMRRTYPVAKGGMPTDVRDHLMMLQDMVSIPG